MLETVRSVLSVVEGDAAVRWLRPCERPGMASGPALLGSGGLRQGARVPYRVGTAAVRKTAAARAASVGLVTKYTTPEEDRGW